MPHPLAPVTLPSIYKVAGQRVPLPRRMAQCTPDTKMALFRIGMAVGKQGGTLLVSDLFRSYDMQLQASLDFESGKKRAFSPRPGGSLHESGRAFDIDLGALKMSLLQFWELARDFGVVPINDKPDVSLSEAWHFECRGSHQRVYDHYASGLGTNFANPYKAMAASTILGAGLRHDLFVDNATAARLQAGLIRLGHNIGNIDGAIGPKTNKALAALELDDLPLEQQLESIDYRLQAEFPGEYFDATPLETGLASRPLDVEPPSDKDGGVFAEAPAPREPAVRPTPPSWAALLNIAPLPERAVWRSALTASSHAA